MQRKEVVVKAILNVFVPLKWVNSLKLKDFIFLNKVAMNQFILSGFLTAFSPQSPSPCRRQLSIAPLH
jgi:hypothetical protein